GVAFSPTGKALVYCAGGVIRAFETDTAAALYETKSPDFAVGLTFSPDGKTLAARGRNQQVRVYDAKTGEELYPLGDPAQVRAGGTAAVILAGGPVSVAPEARTLAYSPDGQRIATAAGGTVRLWAAATGRELPLSDSHHGPLAAVVLSPDGKTVVSWGADRMIRRW